MAKISQAMVDMINNQIAHEKFNCNLYQYMASYFYNKQLNNIGDYFYANAEDELSHAKTFYDYLKERVGAIFQSKAISEVNVTFNNLEELAVAFVNQEIYTTQRIYDIAKLAESEGDRITGEFILKMIKEQYEEEDKADIFLLGAKRIGNNDAFLELWDKEFEND